MLNSKKTSRIDFEELMHIGDHFYMDAPQRGAATSTIVEEHIFLGFTKCKWQISTDSCSVCAGLIKHALSQNRQIHKTGCYTQDRGMTIITLPFDINTRRILDDELFEI